MSLPKPKRILLKLSGEVLMGDQQFGIDPAFVAELAAEVKAAKDTIRKANPNDRDLLATAFLTLGECQRAARLADEEALVSYLTVDLVYNGVPEVHAEALYNLVQLWEATKQPERAREARQALLGNYPQSSWAKKVAGDGAS